MAKLRVIFTVISVYLCLVVFIGCQRAMDETVAATVNGSTISMDSLKSALNFPLENEMLIKENNQVLKAVLDKLIEEELILQEAESQEITITRRELLVEISKIKKDYPGRAFEDMLVKEYILLEEWEKRIKRNLIISKFIKKVIRPEIKPNSADLPYLFEKHKSELIYPRRIKLKHITGTDKKILDRIQKKLIGGETFEVEAAKFYSKEALSAQELTGWINPAHLPSELKSAVIGLGMGQMSSLVKSKYGYSIFKVTEVQPARPMENKDAVAYLDEAYRSQREANALKNWVRKLKTIADIKINPALTVN